MENPYAAPRAEIIAPRGTQAPLTWKQILFSFEGRIPRRTFWGFWFLTNIVITGIMLVLTLTLGEDTGALAALPLYIPAVWIAFALSVKRWHDRDKSGVWMLIVFIPLVGPIWAFIECCCLRGTFGPNKYGEDPT